MDAGERPETRPVATARRGRATALAVMGVAAVLVAIGLLGPKTGGQRGVAPGATTAVVPGGISPVAPAPVPARVSEVAATGPATAGPGEAFDVGRLSLARTPPGLLPAGPADVAVGFGSVWLATDADRTLRRIDPVTLDVTAAVALPGTGTAEARALDVIIGGDAVWVAGPDPGTLHRIDGARPTSGSRIDIGGAGMLVVAGFRGLWVGRDDGALVRLDLRRSGQASVLALGSPAVALAVGGDAVWASTVAGELLRIDPSGRRITARFPAGGGRIAVGPGRVWVADAGVMSAIDETTGELEAVDRGWRVAFDAELFTQPPERRESRISPNRAGLALGLGVWWRWDPVGGQLTRVPRRGG